MKSENHPPLPRDRATLEAELGAAGSRIKGSACTCPNPHHDDQKPSASIYCDDCGAWRVKCHACGWGGDVYDVRAVVTGRPLADVLSEARGGGSPTMPRLVTKPTKPRKVYPTPEAASKAIQAGLRRDGEAWTLTRRHDYSDPQGKLYAAVLRFDSDDDKTYRPMALFGDGWAIGDPDTWYLYRVDELPEAGPVYFVEGEKAADALASVGLHATTTAHGSKSPQKTELSNLAGCDVVIWPDNDDAGWCYAEAVADLLHSLTPPAEVRIIEPPEELPSKGDAFDYVEARDAHDSTDIAEGIDAMAKTAQRWTPSEDQAEAVQSLEWRPFPTHAIPDPAGAFIRDAAKAIGCDEALLAMPMLAMLAGAIGLSRKVKVKRSWHQACTTWAAIVAESGAQKSPALSAVMKPLEQAQARWIKDHEAAMDQHKQCEIEHKKELKDFNEGKYGATALPPLEPEAPTCKRVLVSDATVESLAPILAGNPKGLLLCRDELAGWIDGFDQYKGSKGADVPHWLSMFDAKPLIVDRVVRGTLHVPAAAVSISGGIQPGVLARSIGQANRENGFLGRLLLAMPPRHPKRWSEDDVSEQVENALADRVEQLLSLEQSEEHDSDPAAVLLPMAPEARAVWIDWYNNHAQEQNRLVGDLAAAWSKLESYAVRLALIVQLARNPASTTLDAEAMRSSIELVEWFKHETHRVYAVMDEGETDRQARELLERIEKNGGSMSGRELMQATGGRSYANVGDAEAALQSLVDAGKGKWHQPPQKGPGRPAAKRFTVQRN